MVLACLTIPLFFYFGSYEKYETIKVSLFILFAGLALFAWASGPRLAGVSVPKFFWLLLWGFALMFGLSTLASPDKVASLLGSYLRFTNGLLFFLAWLILLGLFIPIAMEKEKRLFFYKLLFWDASIVAVISLFQSAGIGYYEGLDMPVLARAPGPLGNPNFSTMFMVACLPFAVPLWQATKTLGGRLYYAVSAAIILWAVVVLSSRGAWLGLAVALLCALSVSLIARLPKKTVLAWLALGVVGLIFWLGFSKLTPRPQLISSAVQLTDANVSSRFSVWKVTAKAAVSRPFFGYGPGNFILAYQANRGMGEANLGVFDDPHNLFLRLAAEAGIPATLFFLGLILLVFWNGLRQSFLMKDVFIISAVSGLSGLLVAACFNPVSAPNYLLLAFFIAVLAAKHKNNAQSQALAALGKPDQRVFKAFFRLVGVMFCVFAVLFMAGEVLFFQGLKAFNEGDFRQALKYFHWAQKANPYQELSGIYSAAASVSLGAPETEIQEKIDSVGRLHPARSAAYALQSNLYYYWFFYKLQPRHLDAAIGSMEKAVALDPYFARRYGRLGYYYLLKKSPGRALEEMKTALGMEPGYLPGWLLLAKAYQVQGDKPNTVAALKQTAALKPDSKDLRALLKTGESLDDIRRLNIPGGISPAILE